MTDEQIIKALACLTGTPLKCRECPYSPRYQFPLCQQAVAKDTNFLINRQKAEIERLKEENNHFADIGKMYSEIKAEAIKEFAERVKDLIYEADDINPVSETQIDNLVKEMVGE